MGIQINGQTDTISAVDGGLSVSGYELSGPSNINVTGVVTATTFNGNLTGNVTGNVNSSGVSTVTTISGTTATYTTFNGSLSGTATTATNLADAANITTGTINAARLSGNYSIDITSGVSTTTTLNATNIKHPSFGSNTFVLDSSGNINIDSGGVYYDATNNRLGINTISASKTLDVRGEATFGAGITISDMSWSKDTNQLVYAFSGTAGAGNPSDGAVLLVSPNANPSATRVGSLVYGNKVSGTSVTSNPGIKAVIDCYTNTNVANAADTGAYLNFYTRPDNTNNRVQMTLNSNGVLTKPYQPSFLAYRASGLSLTGGAWQLISNGILTESYDVAETYSTSTNGRFVAPVAGKYMIYAGGYSITGSTGHDRYAMGVKINNAGSPDYLTGGNYSASDTPLVPFQIVLNLAAYDYVELYAFTSIAATWGNGTHWLYWGGYLLG